jgi:hypothetical protein
MSDDKQGPENIVSLDNHRSQPRLDWTLLWLPPEVTALLNRDAAAADMPLETYINEQFLSYLEAYYEEELVGVSGAQLPLFRPTKMLQEVKT